MIKVCVEIDDTECCKGPELRIVPKLGLITEQPDSPTTKPSPKSLTHPCPKFSKRNLIMAFSLTATQQVDVTFTVKDKKGNPARIDGIPTWATDNSDILTVTASADGMTGTVVAVGTLGTANVQVTCDADLGAGVVPLIGTLEVEVTPGVATVIALTPGTPTEQPEQP